MCLPHSVRSTDPAPGISGRWGPSTLALARVATIRAMAGSPLVNSEPLIMAPSTCCPGAGGGALSACQVELGQRPWATRSRGAQIASSRSWLVNDCGCLLANGTTPGKSDPEPDIRQYLTKVSKSLSAPLRLPVDKKPLHISRGVRAWLETTLVSGSPWPRQRHVSTAPRECPRVN
jgi:hypothetical protein